MCSTLFCTFHHRFKIFMLCFQRNSTSLHFISGSGSFSVKHVSLDIIIQSKKTWLCCCFFSLKVRVAKMTITSTFITNLNTGCGLHTNQNRFFSHWLPCGANGHVTTKISRTPGYSNFLTHDSTGELRYASFNQHSDFLEVKVKIVIQKEFKRTM